MNINMSLLSSPSISSSSISSEATVSPSLGSQSSISSYQPSLKRKLWSHVTSLENFPSYVVFGSAALLGASLPVSMAIGGGCLVAQKLLKKVITGGESLRPGVFIGSENMSELVEGGLHSHTIPPVLQCIKKMDSSNAKKVETCLKSILDYVNHFDYTGMSNESLVAHYHQIIKDLKPGQMAALPCSSFSLSLGASHAMVAVFQRQENGKFSVTIHNGGYGVDQYHFAKSHRSEKLYQTALEITDINMSNLLEFITNLAKLHALRKGNSVEKLYTTLIPALKGTYQPANPDDSRVWSKGQTGTSCSGYSIKCMVKSLLTKDEYRTFKAIFFSHIAMKLIEGLQSNRFWEQTQHHYTLQKILKLKLLGLPKEHIPKEVLEFLEKPFKGQFSTLGTVSQTIDRLFWTAIFSPTDLLDSRFLSNLIRKKSLNHAIQVFNKINPFLARDILSLMMIKEPSRGEKLTIHKLRYEFSQLYLQIDSSHLTLSEIRRIDQSFKEFFIAIDKKYDKDSVPSWKKYRNNVLDKIETIQKVMKPYYKKNLSFSLCSDLMLAIELYKKGKKQAAKESIAKAYTTIKKISRELTSKQVAEVILVQEEFLSIYLVKSLLPETAEELEFYAAMESSFGLLKAKCSSEDKDGILEMDPSSVVEIFKSKSEDQIKGSIWEKDMEESYAVFLKTQKDLESSKVKTPSYLIT